MNAEDDSEIHNGITFAHRDESILAFDDRVVLSVRANPKPDEVLIGFDCQCSVVCANSRRPIGTDRLKLNRGMT